MIDLKRERSVQHMALVSAIRYSLSTHIWERKQRVAFVVNVDVLGVEALCTAQCMLGRSDPYSYQIHIEKCYAPTSRKQTMYITKYISLDKKARIYHLPTDATLLTMEWILVERSKMFADGAEII